MRISIRKLILSNLILVVFFFFLTFSLSQISKARSLNVLLISIDTLRADHVGVYGYSKNTTPNIDEWAKKGTVYTNVSTVVPMTHPSFAALMTGKSPFNTRIITNGGDSVSNNSKTLAQILKDNGYKTAFYISKGDASIDQGIDDVNINSFKTHYHDEDDNERFTQSSRAEYEKFILKSADYIKASKNNKFFLWVHLMDVHQPYFPPEDLRCKFNQEYCREISEKTLKELDSFRAEYQFCQNGKVPTRRVEMMKTLYDGGVASADRLTGKILSALKEAGLDKNTLIVIVADHGEGFDHNYYFNHREVLYDSATKIPFIVINPISKGPDYSTKTVQNIDVLPTLLDILKINKGPYRFDGESFAGSSSILHLLKPPKQDFKYAVNSFWTKFSISDGKFKYIYSMPGSCTPDNQNEELYNLADDPGELKNLVNTEKNRVSFLRRKLLEYLSQYNLPLQKNGSTQDNPGVSGGEGQPKDVDNIRTLGY